MTEAIPRLAARFDAEGIPEAIPGLAARSDAEAIPGPAVRQPDWARSVADSQHEAVEARSR